MFSLLGGIFLGWSLGANDAGNVFGSAVGAILGVGIVKGINTVSRQTLANVLIGWFLTPVIATFIAIGLYFAIHLRYVPKP